MEEWKERERLRKNTYENLLEEQRLIPQKPQKKSLGRVIEKSDLPCPFPCLHSYSSLSLPVCLFLKPPQCLPPHSSLYVCSSSRLPLCALLLTPIFCPTLSITFSPLEAMLLS